MLPAVPLLMVLVAFTETQGGLERAPYLDAIISNRQAYADRHGYQLLIKNAAKYSPIAPVNPSAVEHDSWIKLYALREVLQEHPEADWIWYLDPEALIMDQSLSLVNDILKPSVLSNLILRDVPVVPGENIIKTLKTPDMESIDFILSQDQQGFNAHSFLLRRGDYAKYLLESWYDPLFRAYDKFENHATSALEHMLEWHYTTLYKAALVPKRLLCSYINAAGDMGYKEGDFVLFFEGCNGPARSCEHEIDRWYRQTAEGKSGTTAAVPATGDVPH
ncbi:galactosyl transferase [Protomyces lactucae-debilis]|uniref:Galactosyl transferase n=1 Tax=Protomyces lactucae-debilis TaxID=2754530 RepID=A0A1Y2FBA4_PROLT|nr:galactosyl transferase [Protomyces lactucae-debilis]ORY80907.1 galactosyl transferase [Protomyces lactucae-debilis]